MFRYALYEYWLSHYAFTSYILILDFRDTFFQLDPFLDFGPFDQRLPKYELQLYEENFKVWLTAVAVLLHVSLNHCFCCRSRISESASLIHCGWEDVLVSQP